MTNTKTILFVFLVLLGMIVSPVCAASYTLTGYDDLLKLGLPDMEKTEFDNVYNLTFDLSNQDKAIQLIHFKAPMDHTVSFTIYYGAGNSVSGSASTAWNISLLPLHTTTSSITFNGETKGYSYGDLNPEFDYFLSGYARDDDSNATGLIVYNAGYGGFDNDLAIFMPITNLPVNLIYKVVMSCDAPFDADITFAGAKNVAATVDKSILDILKEWLDLGLKVAGQIKVFVLGFISILKFLFVDNILLVVALWISVTMAYSAISTRGNIFKFYAKFFKYQKTLLSFIMEMWEYLARIIATVRSWI